MRASRLVSLLLLLQSRGGQTAVGARARAGGLGPDHPSRRRGAERLRRPDLRRPRPAWRHPPRRRLPDAADGNDRGRGRRRCSCPGCPARRPSSAWERSWPRPGSRSSPSLPTELRARASRLVERFHLDAAAWYHADEPVPLLGPAVGGRLGEPADRNRIRPRRQDVDRVLEPLGLVLKAGVWYLVANADGQPRTYRVSRVVRVTPLEEAFERPDAFDLAAFWTESRAPTSATRRGSASCCAFRRIDSAAPARGHRRAAGGDDHAARRARSRRLDPRPGEPRLARRRWCRRSWPSAPSASSSSRSTWAADRRPGDRVADRSRSRSG